jgi:phosphatidylglycerol:prolipoprotein diacylglycerol transferase
VLVQLGPIAIRWYGLALCRRHPARLALCARNVRSQRLWDRQAPMTPLDVDDFVPWATLGVIRGGRIGYVLFYNPAHFASHPVEIIQPWNGGMSFHGGFSGMVVAVVLFAQL